MILTNKQEQGLKICLERFKNKEQYTTISGYAGTGKSTLVKFIVSALGLEDYEVAYVTFTGKAAEVLRKKGCHNATTAHKLLYYSKQLPNGKFFYKPKNNLDPFLRLIVVDEISMLPKDLWELLLSHRIHIIACGDPFQLPPINKDADNHVLDKPHIFLDEIMRQAQESEIIRLTMDIREGKPIKYQQGQEVHVVPHSQMVDGMYTWADQIIVGTNNKRHEINNYMRAAANRGPEPEEGDKVICLRNCWDRMDDNQEIALVNGTIGYLKEPFRDEITIPLFGLPDSIDILESSLITDDGTSFTAPINMDYNAITTGNKTLTSQQEYLIYKSVFKGSSPIEFNYGYAITCHRAQGSQWDKVMVVEERFPFDKEAHARWLYTACTRAAEKLVLVR